MPDAETVLARVRLGSYAGLFALLPLAIGAFFAFGVGSSAIPFVVLNTLFWLPVLVFGVLERGVLKVGPQGVVWIRGVGRLSFRRVVPVDAWTWSRVVVLRHFGLRRSGPPRLPQKRRRRFRSFGMTMAASCASSIGRSAMCAVWLSLPWYWRSLALWGVSFGRRASRPGFLRPLPSRRCLGQSHPRSKISLVAARLSSARGRGVISMESGGLA